MTLISKAVLYRDARWIWSGGLGVTAPLADDAKLMLGDETLLRIRNQAVYLLPYTAWLYRYDDDNFFQFNSQLDIDVNGNPVAANLFDGSLRDEGRYTDASLIHLDFTYNHVLASNRQQAGLRDLDRQCGVALHRIARGFAGPRRHRLHADEHRPTLQHRQRDLQQPPRVSQQLGGHARDHGTVAKRHRSPIQFQATLQLNYLR